MPPQKTFAIGDLHGRFDLLLKVEEFLTTSFPEGGKLVVLGDMIDRGPQSRQIIEHIMLGSNDPKWEWIAIKGNHEDMLLASLRDFTIDRQEGVFRWWLGHGGEATCSSYGGYQHIPQDHIDWLRSLPSYYVDDHRLYVHAGVNPDKPLAEQSDDSLLWIFHDDDMTRGCEHYHVVHGHSDRQRPLCVEGRTCLDVGAYKHDWIAIAEFDDEQTGGAYRIHSIA